jgi:hypothetical protein
MPPTPNEASPAIAISMVFVYGFTSTLTWQLRRYQEKLTTPPEGF